MEENGQKTMKKTKGPERLLTFINQTPYESKYPTHILLVQQVLFMQRK